MKRGKNSCSIAGRIAAVLSCLLLFSCSDDDFIDGIGREEIGKKSDNISFGISRTKASSGKTKEEYTADRFVLRSIDAPDTLCARAMISDRYALPFGGKTPEARSAPVSSIETYGAFRVQAHCTENGIPLGTFYMDDTVDNLNGSEWSTDNVYYWPGEGRSLRFFAWAPVDANFTAIPGTPESTTLSYTVPDNVAEQKDIVVAATDEISGDLNMVVPLTFRHICTAVTFETGSRMQPGSIKSVTLKGVKKSGVYDMAAGGWRLDDPVADFSQTLNKNTDGTEASGSEITTADGTFMMLPQTLPSGAMVEVVFSDRTTGQERTLSASIAGTQWPMGETVTYKLSITPEYELEFISEPELQDAHYVIYPIHIKAGEVSGGWTMTSADPSVTLRTDLTMLTRRGYWIEEDRGSSSISSTAVGDDITVYAFLEENVSSETRNVTLELRPADKPDATPATFTISQLCPSWNGNLGCERIEDGDYPWGFLWPAGMKVTYNMQNAGLGDLIKNALLNAYLSWFTDYGQFITKETWLLSITSVTINYDAVSQVAVAKDEDNGMKNTLELYNFNGINDVSTLEDILKNWGGVPDKELPLNPEEFAARSASMRNKYHKTVEQQGGQTIEVPVLPQDEITWYLPSKNEAMQMKDADYPLIGEYWTSTNSTSEHDNENAYKYAAGGSTLLERRDVNLHVRAVRKKP